MYHFMLIYFFYFPVDETSSARSTGQDHGIYLFVFIFQGMAWILSWKSWKIPTGQYHIDD